MALVMLRIIYQQAAGHHAGAEDHHGCEDNFPGIHQEESAACSWSAAANTVFSNSWGRLLVGAFALGAKKDQALNSSIKATHGAAARQSARDHNAQWSGHGRARIRAMIRFSKA